MRIKEVVLGIAIIVLTIFVTFYGINTIFPSPDYNTFCKPDRVLGIINTTAQCESVGGKWNPTYYTGEPAPAKTEAISGYCDIDYTCRQEFDTESKMRSRNVFFIALPLGVLIIAVGAFFFGLEAVGAGLMGGGIGTLIYGSGAYWPYTENWIRFVISLIGLVLIIWLAYFFNNKFGKKNQRKRRR